MLTIKYQTAFKKDYKRNLLSQKSYQEEEVEEELSRYKVSEIFKILCRIQE